MTLQECPRELINYIYFVLIDNTSLDIFVDLIFSKTSVLHFTIISDLFQIDPSIRLCVYIIMQIW
jgi:hypothetical protein